MREEGIVIGKYIFDGVFVFSKRYFMNIEIPPMKTFLNCSKNKSFGKEERSKISLKGMRFMIILLSDFQYAFRVTKNFLQKKFQKCYFWVSINSSLILESFRINWTCLKWIEENFFHLCALLKKFSGFYWVEDLKLQHSLKRLKDLISKENFFIISIEFFKGILLSNYSEKNFSSLFKNFNPFE